MALRRQRSDGGEDDVDLDEQLLNLLPDELRDSDDVYLDDDMEPPRGRGGILAIMFGIFFGLLVAGIAAWYLLGGAGSHGAQGPNALPVIAADGKPYKTRPEEPGGMKVENKDKLVYNRIADGDGTVKPEEKLLPEAEQPKEPPATAAAPPSAPSGGAVPKSPPLAKGASMLPPPSPVETDRVAPPPSPPSASGAIAGGDVTASGQNTAKQPAPVDLVGSESKDPQHPMPVAPKSPAPPKRPAPVTPKPVAAPPAPVPPAPAPVVPQPSSSATPAARQATGAKGNTFVQVAALRSKAAAEEAWRDIQTKSKALLGGFPHKIVRADLGDKGIYFRLRVGPVGNRAQAKVLCETLKSRGQGCIVVR